MLLIPFNIKKLLYLKFNIKYYVKWLFNRVKIMIS